MMGKQNQMSREGEWGVGMGSDKEGLPEKRDF